MNTKNLTFYKHVKNDLYWFNYYKGSNYLLACNINGIWFKVYFQNNKITHTVKLGMSRAYKSFINKGQFIKIDNPDKNKRKRNIG